MKFILNRILFFVILLGLETTLFAQNAKKISPNGVSWIDPEILNSDHKMAFQVGGSGFIWLGDINPLTGLFVNSGTDLLIDNGATPLTTSINGPEFGISANGWSVYYTKANNGTPQPWRALINGSSITKAPLISGSTPRLSTLASKDTNATSIRLLYGKGATLNNSQLGWIDEVNPATETIVDSLDNGVRWINNTQSMVYTKQTGSNAGQLAIYNTDSLSETIISNDADLKTNSYGWFAPEFNNDLVVLSVINDTLMGIYRNLGNQYWDRVLTIPSPPAAQPFKYFGSPEPFVANGKSYVSFVLKAVNITTSYVDAEVWAMDFNPDINQRVMIRCDDGLPNTKRTDPESYIGTKEVFIYYNQINNNNEFEIWRYATGITTSITSSIDESNNKHNSIVFYPNPTHSNLFIKTTYQGVLHYIIINSIGQVIKEEQLNVNSIDVSSLKSGIYFIQIKAENGEVITRQFVKQ